MIPQLGRLVAAQQASLKTARAALETAIRDVFPYKAMTRCGVHVTVLPNGVCVEYNGENIVDDVAAGRRALAEAGLTGLDSLVLKRQVQDVYHLPGVSPAK